MSLTCVAVPFDRLTGAEVHDVARLRQDVFVVEQECPYPDLDGRDLEPGTRHLLLEDIAAEVGGIAVPGDAADPVHARDVIDAAVAEFGGVDVVVANAGIDRPGSAVEVTDVDWHRTIDVNLTATGATAASTFVTTYPAGTTRPSSVGSASSTHCRTTLSASGSSTRTMQTGGSSSRGYSR